jgi:single-strand DNA-binding protein
MVGRLTRDPELRNTPGGTAVVNFGIAVNREWKDQQTGEDRGEVLFLDVSAFGRTAEVVHQYRHKGGEVLCDGYLRLEQWDDRQTGEKRQAIKMVANRVQLIGSDGNEGGGRGRPGGDRSEPDGRGGWVDRGGQGAGGNRPQQRPANPPTNRGSVAGVPYPRRQTAQNAPNQSRQTPGGANPGTRQTTNAPQGGQRRPESARNDRYGSGRSPQNDPGGFNPEDNEDGDDGGYYDPNSYADDGPPAIGGSQSRGDDHGDMQPLADTFDRPQNDRR